MRRTLLVTRHEFTSAVSRRSFWFMTFLFPVIILVLSFGNTFAGDLGEESLQEALAPGAVAGGLGYVDRSGVVGELPPDVPPGLFREFSSVDQAAAALEEGRIGGYYIVPEDFLRSRELTLVQEDFEPFATAGTGPAFEYAINHAVTGDARVAAALADPIANVQMASVGGDELGGEEAATAADGDAGSVVAEEDRPSADTIAGLIPFATLFILFFVITSSSSYLLQSVTKEKENRTAELLLLSVRPRELMLGKVLGLGGVALVQVGVWIGGGLLVLWRYLGVPDPAAIGVSASLLGWLFAFLVLGFVAYGSLLAALGTLVPSQREGTQLMFVALSPLMLPLLLNFTLMEDTDGIPATALSLFPLSAPVAMVTRVASGGVPVWQPISSLVGLALTAYLFVVIGARVFRADTLLSTEAFSPRRLVAALRSVLRAG